MSHRHPSPHLGVAIGKRMLGQGVTVRTQSPTENRAHEVSVEQPEEECSDQADAEDDAQARQPEAR